MEAKRAILKRREDGEQVELSSTKSPTRRVCTRCDGYQHLLGTAHGFGKYRCDTCQIVIGFDVESEPAEFILDRGAPSNYTKQLFGPNLSTEEQRIP